MNMPKTSLIEWQKKFDTEESCLEKIQQVRWPNGFICPKCGTAKHCFISTRSSFECSKCHHQTSITSGTIFHSTNLPLVKWFWAIYLMASDKGSISALRLSKQIEVSWVTAHRMLRKIRTAMMHRDSIYRLENFVELDDAYIGGKKPGKRGRGAAGKKAIIVAVEQNGERAGFMAAKDVERITKETVRDFLNRHMKPRQKVRTDAFPSLNSISESHEHDKKVTPASEAGTWLPLVHIVIGNLKKFINGTFHGVSHKYLSEYVAEFCYRFNRRFWEAELPMRVLNACSAHLPVKTRTENC